MSASETNVWNIKRIDDSKKEFITKVKVTIEVESDDDKVKLPPSSYLKLMGSALKMLSRGNIKELQDFIDLNK